MLIAWASGKGRRLSEKDELEDEIVSAVFGPLRYAEKQDVWRFVRGLLGYLKYSDQALSEIPGADEKVKELTVSFWKRWNISDDLRTGSEPDVLIYACFGENKNYLLILEAKWRSGPSGDNQLVQQWCLRQSSAPLAKAFQIYLTKEKSKGQCVIDAEAKKFSSVADSGKRAWLDSVKPMAWQELSEFLSAHGSLSPPLKLWGEDVEKFIASLGYPIFQGFDESCVQHLPMKYSSPWIFNESFLFEKCASGCVFSTSDFKRVTKTVTDCFDFGGQ